MNNTQTPYSDLADDRLIEVLFSTRTSVRALRDLQGKSRWQRRMLRDTKMVLPAVEAEVSRRGLEIPRWVAETFLAAPRVKNGNLSRRPILN